MSAQKRFTFILFLTVIFLITVNDAILAYFAPIYLEDKLGNASLMGLILATSSVIGIATDFIVGHRFGNKNYQFFLRWTMIYAFLFPVVLVVSPPALPFMILAMAVWGIYYELIQFSSFFFIDRVVDYKHHARMWGIMSTMRALAYTIGPVVASTLIVNSAPAVLFFTVLIYLFAIMVLIFLLNNTNSHKVVRPVEEKRKIPIAKEIVIWLVFLRKIWHVLGFLFVASLLDATFWSVGTLLSEKMNNNGLLFVVYELPPLFVGLIVGRIAIRFGKKRTAFIAGILASLPLCLMYKEWSNVVILGIVFVSSIFISMAWPLVFATIENYISRLDDEKSDLIGLQSAMNSLAYIIGPLVAGTLASLFGTSRPFAIIGGLLLVLSVINLIFTPRKVRLPQKKLNEIAEVIVLPTK